MRSTLVYVILVGIPVIALIGVLRIGERIPAPQYVGGKWRLEVEPSQTDACSPPVEVEVIQSGIVLELQVEGTTKLRADARLDGGVLRSQPLHGDTPCSGIWALEARLTNIDGIDRLIGRWITAGCETCPSPSIRGDRIAVEARVM
jgi:hypothetical protein